MKAAAIAHANIALVKYWGKRGDTPAELNLPAVGSISITLGGLSTRTEVVFERDTSGDELHLTTNGTAVAVDDHTRRRVSALIDLIRARASLRAAVRVTSDNDFPTGAGLASSASGFAALAVAGAAAAGLDLSPAQLAALARCGSGSAARSIFGGFVELTRGSAGDGSDCVAAQLAEPGAWPLSVLVAVTSTAAKPVSSTAGMERTADTSPYYDAWVDSHPADLAAARGAIAARDFERLAEVTERSCLAMHGLMLAARPGLVYWNAATVALIAAVRGLRAHGTPVCFTIDAGPQVKVICPPFAAPVVREAIAGVPGVVRLIESGLGSGARLTEGRDAP